MKLTLEVNLGENPDQSAVMALIAAAHHVDMPGKKPLGEILHEQLAYQNFAFGPSSEPQCDAVTTAVDGEQAEQAAEEGGEEDGTDVQSGAEASAPNATKVPKRRGRRSNAEITAAKAAEAAAAAMVAGAKADVELPAEEQQQPAGITLPPGVTMAQTTQPSDNVVVMSPGITLPPGVTQTTVPAPTPAAMPAVQQGAIPAAAAGDVIPLEAFKAEFLASNARLPNKAWIVMKETTWPDGSPKVGSFTAEGVPPQDRERLLQIWSMLT